MARATFERVGKRFGETLALADFSLAAADGELIVVLGPSGCGKSTLLRVTAGLERASTGAIHLDGRRIDTLVPEARDVAMVFQSYALYPHLTVAGNIEFPLRMRRVAAAARRRRVEEVAALLEIGALLGRQPAALSGGQRQRVALARALVRHPALFLLDEPLSNLDARLRTSVRRYIRDVQRRLGVTTLYVTHDQTEALTLADRVVVLDHGRIQQVDTPLATYERPANVFVAGFVGTPPMNVLPADYAQGTLRVGAQAVTLSADLRARLGATAGPVLIGVRPEAFVPVDGSPAGALVVTLDAGRREALGSETLVGARLGDAEVTVRLPGAPRALPARAAAGADALHLFTCEGTRLGP
jgi:ABC-type sugar transport system ATPase subunit